MRSCPSHPGGPHVPTDRYARAPGRVGIHWFEQSAFALKNADGLIVLIDPYFPSNRPPDRFVHVQRPVDPGTIRPDLLLLTHDHGDHTHPESIREIAAGKRDTIFVGPEEAIARIISEASVQQDRTRVARAGHSLVAAGVTVHPVYSKPPDGDPDAGIDPPNTTHLGYVVEFAGRRLYFTGDPVNTLADLPALTEPIRALDPEIGFLTTHPTEGEFPFFGGALGLAKRIGLKRAVPSHYECFVKRNYDPAGFQAVFAGSGIQVTVIPWNDEVEL